ncbi:uncharacterized protein TRIADDRAFT_57351 [Trichoplax adhaerens]|uniref:VWFA domain-containing protein n=1 Tax=Trichoplax adhaerens TaxID=10228 RepID=B3RZ73_TRIAD|nr:hypothetical protein TRIADDRAFT_57351 [Trichoplax adhaerens]EDV24152.1 hypothetical protein TRIADDRAFT_57351 [Trichoplax adhaerens]|eukprot:XP_002113678.1 hypothetical protein TRIADDRAFT_57351 [Trichoplax adhaerens]
MADDADDVESGYRWESSFERTWEVLVEDEQGSLKSTVDELQRARKRRVADRKANVRLGLMRHMYIIVDMSSAISIIDLKPNRLVATVKLLDDFITEYFDQNPISQLGVIITRNKRAEKLTDIGGNPRRHIAALRQAACKPCIGEPSLQNALELASQTLRHVPSHASREILVIYASLTSCDPSDIHATVKNLVEDNIRCSAIGLSAEMYILKKLASETGGSYRVILDEHHYKELLTHYVIPPVATGKLGSSLIRMGFPEYRTNSHPSMCQCHLDSRVVKSFSTTGYFCPQCKAKYCELPIECQICGKMNITTKTRNMRLSLVSAPHLARSYQHLFPLEDFEEVALDKKDAEKPL